MFSGLIFGDLRCQHLAGMVLRGNLVARDDGIEIELAAIEQDSQTAGYKSPDQFEAEHTANLAVQNLMLRCTSVVGYRSRRKDVRID